MMNNADAAALMRWRLNRDAEGFHEICERYSGMVYATCRRILGNPQDAEDVAQECFEALCRTKGAPDQYLGPWLHRVATNKSLKHLRSQSRRSRREQSYFGARQIETEAQSWGDLYELVDEAIDGLPEKYRTVLIAHFYEHQSHAEIAEMSGLIRPTVTYRITKAVDLVRVFLRRRGISVSAMALAAMLAANLRAEAAPAGLTTMLGKLAVAGPVIPPTAISAMAMAKAAATFISLAVVLLVVREFYHGVPSKNVKNAPPAVVTNASLPAQQDAQEVAPADIAPANKTASPPTAASAGTISGRVYEFLAGVGLAGAEVQACLDGAPQGRSGMSDSNGRYAVNGLAEGIYEVKLVKSSKPQTRSVYNATRVNLPRDEEVKDVDFTVGRACEGLTVSGTTVDESGSPVADAWVRMSNRNEGCEYRETHSGGDGTFELADVWPALSMDIMATTDALCSKREQVAVLPDSSQNLVIVLYRGATVKGQVVFPDGAPAGGIPVFVSPTSGGEPVNKEAKSDENGTFAIAPLPPGGFAVAAGPNAPQERYVPVELEAEAVIDGIRLTVERPRTPPWLQGTTHLKISGSVLDQNGKPMEGIAVACRDLGAEFLEKIVRSAPDGTYELDDLTEGNWWVHAQPPRGYFRGEMRVGGVSAPPAGDNSRPIAAGATDVDLVLCQVDEVAGRVIRKGADTPVTRFTICHMGPGGTRGGWCPTQSAAPVVYSDAAGRFHLANGDGCQLLVRAKGFASATVPLPDVATGAEDITVELEPSARIVGRVLDPSGRPLSGALIRVGDIGQGEDSLLPLDHSRPAIDGDSVVCSRADGTFVMDPVPDFFLQSMTERINPKNRFGLDLDPETPKRKRSALAYHARFGYARSPLSIAPGQSISLTLQFADRERYTVRGVVLARGEPAGGVRVFVIPATGQETVTGPDGTYKMEGVPLGNDRKIRAIFDAAALFGMCPFSTVHYSVAVLASDTGETRADLAPLAGNASLNLLATAKGKPAKVAVVLLSNEVDSSETTEIHTETNSDGLLYVDGLAPGSWSVVVRNKLQLVFEARDGETAQLVAELAPSTIREGGVLKPDAQGESDRASELRRGA